MHPIALHRELDMHSFVRFTLLFSTALGGVGLMAAPVPARAEGGGADPAPAAAAQATTSIVDSPENVIIITARRRSDLAQDVPIAIGVLDGRTINDTGAFSVYKIQQLTPTLQIYSSNPRNTAVNIRGIGVPFGLTNDGFCDLLTMSR